MVSPTQPTAFRRLSRLAVTVFLNLVLTFAVIGLVVGNKQSVTCWFWLPVGGCSVTCERFGWAIMYGSIANLPQLFEIKVRDPDVDTFLYEDPPNAERVEFLGGFACSHSVGHYVVLQHCFILSVLTALQAIHHRRLIARLVRRR